MKKIYLLLLYFAPFSLFSQLSFNPNPVVVEDVASDDFEGVGDGFLIHEGSAEITVVWERNVIEITDGWDNAVCDKNQCYLPTVGTKQFIIGPNESANMDIHAYPNSLEGSAIIELIAKQVDDTSNVASCVYYFNATPNGTIEINKEYYAIFPNPAKEAFTIKGDNNIDQVIIFNAAGKNIKTVQYEYNKWYDLGDVSNGTYFVRLTDKKGKLLATKVLHKL